MADIIVLSTANAAMADYPLLLQAAGGDPAISYTGPDFRQLIEAVTQAGVCGMTDFRVTQRAAGTNLTVDVAAGKAVVTGTSVTRQGRFLVDSTGIVNLGNITVPGAGTRTHRVIIRARDKQASGTAYGWSLEVLEDTGSGLPALPASAIDLATISVPSGTAAITNAMITDRRAYACPQLPLAVTTLAVDTASVLFDGIPGAIRGLELHWAARSSGVGGAFVLGARVNADSGSNYGRMYRTLVNNNTATPTDGRSASVDTYLRLGIIPGSTVTAGIFGAGRATIPKWSNLFGVTRVNANYESGYWVALGEGAQEDGMGYWVGTASPASLTLIATSGSLLAGSQFILKALA